MGESPGYNDNERKDNGFKDVSQLRPLVCEPTFPLGVIYYLYNYKYLTVVWQVKRISRRTKADMVG